MKRYIGKLTVALLCAAAVGLGHAAGANAAVITFNDFSDLSGLQLNNSTAAVHGCPTCGPVIDDQNRNVLRLTDGLSQAGSAFLTDAISLDQNASFSTAFQFRMSNPLGGFGDVDGFGADGLVFVVQTQGNTAGSSGGGIGYEGLTNSVGIEFDTWRNPVDDGSGNHVGIDLNGNSDSVAQQHLATRLNDGDVWFAWVDYNGLTGTMEVRLSASAARPTDALVAVQGLDLVTELGQTDAFVGFTSATGGAGQYHDILAWQFDSTFNPIDTIGDSIPGPAPLTLLAFGLAALGLGRRRLRLG